MFHYAISLGVIAMGFAFQGEVVYYFGLWCWFYFYIKIYPFGFSFQVVFFFLSLSHLSHLSNMFAMFMVELISIFCLSDIWGHSLYPCSSHVFCSLLQFGVISSLTNEPGSNFPCGLSLDSQIEQLKDPIKAAGRSLALL